MIGNGSYLGFDEIKAIICGIEGLYLESFMKDIQINIQTKVAGV